MRTWNALLGAWFLFGLLFDPADGVHTFPRNAGEHVLDIPEVGTLQYGPDYNTTASYGFKTPKQERHWP
jgi:hypothetical protein